MKLTDTYYEPYIAMLEVDIHQAFEQVKQRAWNSESFRFYTAVSVMSSARIEGETLEIDSYLKHKMQQIEYLPNLTEKPNDLFEAYEFARANALTLPHFLEAHRMATRHLLPASQRGVVRKGNMLIMDQQSQKVRYEAALATVVHGEFKSLWADLDGLLQQKLTTEQVFYYAALLHLVLVKIHPFNDGNGRTARLLEKWFLATLLGDKAWYIASEHYYYNNLKDYYHNLARVGLFYDALHYEHSLPFLLMLPKCLPQDEEQ